MELSRAIRRAAPAIIVGGAVAYYLRKRRLPARSRQPALPPPSPPEPPEPPTEAPVPAAEIVETTSPEPAAVTEAPIAEPLPDEAAVEDVVPVDELAEIEEAPAEEPGTPVDEAPTEETVAVDEQATAEPVPVEEPGTVEQPAAEEAAAEEREFADVNTIVEDLLAAGPLGLRDGDVVDAEVVEEEQHDAALAEAVRIALAERPGLLGGGVEVEVTAATVILRGEVERQEVGAELERRAAAVRGVRDVRNMLHSPGAPG